MQVVFPNGTDYVLMTQLEKLQDDLDDPIDLLKHGRLGRARDLRGLLTYIRLNGRLANIIYSMETTNTDFYAYQFKPVLNFLESPNSGLLIADEVGLGKTIEAGLIWTELRSRFDSRKLLVLCPAMLQEKWKAELINRFGIRADILNASGTRQRLTEYRNGEISEFAIIGSMQGLRPRRGWSGSEPPQDAASLLAQFLSEIEFEEPLIDLLVIDEAHYLRNPESMTSKLGRLLRSASTHIVLLSATPVHLKSADLYQLLNLVDEDTFNQPWMFDEILEANEPLLRAKDLLQQHEIDRDALIKLLEEAKKHPLMEGNRQLAAILDDPPSSDDLGDASHRSYLSSRIESINLLSRAVTRTRKREVTEFRVIREAIPEMIPMTFAEGEFYSKITDLVRDYALRGERHEAFLVVMPQRQMSSSMPAALREWKMKKEMFPDQMYEDIGLDNDNLEIGPLTREIIAQADQLGNLEELWATDSKYNRLRGILLHFLKSYPKEKIILFAYFRPTLRYLQNRLSEDGIPSVVLMGGMEDKNGTIERFRKSGGPRVLLSSEVASEGIDLQFCRFLINYDLPWNPMRVEQRIGRLDRIGQKSPVITVWNLFYRDTIDARIYTRLYERLKIFEHALGAIEPVIGDYIHRLTLDLLRGKLSPEQEDEQVKQTAQALANLRAQEEKLEEEAATLVAHGDYILNHIKATRELERSISADDLWTYTHDFFLKHFQGSEFVQTKPDRLEFDVKLTEPAKMELEYFLKRNQMQGKTRIAAPGLQRVRCIFDNHISAARRGKSEIISQFHPLTRFVSAKIEEFGADYYPVVSVELSRHDVPNAAPGRYVFAAEKWSLQGMRDIELLCFKSRLLEIGSTFLPDEIAEQLVTSAARKGKDWLSASNVANLEMASELVLECYSEMELQYDKYVQQIEYENNDRADIQEKSLLRHRDRQIERLREVREKLLERGKERLVRATEGRIAALESRIERKLLEIKKRRDLRHHKQPVCIGLIDVL